MRNPIPKTIIIFPKGFRLIITSFIFLKLPSLAKNANRLIKCRGGPINKTIPIIINIIDVRVVRKGIILDAFWKFNFLALIQFTLV